MNIIPAIYFNDKMDFKSSLYIAELCFDEVNEEYNYCVQREKGKEVIEARKVGIPYIAYTRNKKGEAILIESNFDLDSVSKEKYVISPRGNNEYDSLFGFQTFLSKKDDDKILNWFENIKKSDIGRKVEALSQANLLYLIENELLEKPTFIKTLDKGKHRNTVNLVWDEDTKDLLISNSERPDFHSKSVNFGNYFSEESTLSLKVRGYTYYNEYSGFDQTVPDQYRSIDGDMMISEVININSDTLSGENKKEEYRVYVIGDEVNSISRYFDYVSVDIPQSIIEEAENFVSKYKGILPSFYIVDFAMTDKGVAIVELNPYTMSGRYVQNCANKLYSRIKELSNYDFNILLENVHKPSENQSISKAFSFDDLDDIDFGEIEIKPEQLI